MEQLSRAIVVYAEDGADAYEQAEELCNNDTVRLTDDDFDSREFFTCIASPSDMEWCASDIYGKEV